jgi:hypothetical protein
MSLVPPAPKSSLAADDWENEGGSLRVERATTQAPPLLLPRRSILALRKGVGS